MFFGGKGNGKGKGGKYPVRNSGLPIEDRRRKLRELKARAERGREASSDLHLYL